MNIASVTQLPVLLPKADAGPKPRFGAILATRLERKETTDIIKNPLFGTHAKVSLSTAEIRQAIDETAERLGVDPDLAQAVVKAESNYNPSAVSSAGALGLMQLMPGTAKDLGVTDPLDPYQNIEGGITYLKKLLDRYDGDAALALASYNWGPGAVASRDLTDLSDPLQLEKVPSSVQKYINRVLGYTNSYSTGW
jgi:soluble lytic murein transglycosylase-like protein